MKSVLFSFFLVLVPCYAYGNPEVCERLQKCAVTVKADRATGSGFISIRGDWIYVLTAGHVVDGLRTVREATDGQSKKTITFRDAQVVQKLILEGRTVGSLELDAEVLRFSDSEYGEDLALLRVRHKKAFSISSFFWLDVKIPPVGTEGYHCGSPMGEFGHNSVIPAFVAKHGSVIPDQPSKAVYDQLSCNAFPGSSGGMVTDKTGKVIGMVVRGANGGFILMVPIRRIREWSKKVGIEFILDDKLPIPTDEQLKAYPIDDSQGKPTETKMPPVKGAFFLYKLIGYSTSN